MLKLEEVSVGAAVLGIVPSAAVTVVGIQWHGTVLEVTYKDASGRLAHELLFRDRESGLELLAQIDLQRFDGDGSLYRLTAEAKRIGLAYLFDPLLAIHISQIEPLPHQITAVYGEMISRQPLRYLLADDPGAGKTIMAGLLIKELLLRGDLKRCLICCPGNLAEQWQDELETKFHLPFEIVDRSAIEASRTGNPFLEKDLVVSRLDLMSRSDDILAKLEPTDWDLVVVDEAHKMHASFFTGELKETKRYKLGKQLGRLTRHLLLLTATPHNGKEEEFQLFMALLDADRFEGRFRDGVHKVDVSDLMRRLTKESLLKFDGKPLFPERIANTVAYTLSDLEAKLYAEVTDYVCEEMNRAERLANEGEKRRGNLVGFALTILQRRLASSPEAIHQSLRRRRERLEKRLREEQIKKRGADVIIDTTDDLPVTDQDDLEDIEDAPSAESEVQEQQIVDQASAAKTITELGHEIDSLKQLEARAQEVLRSRTDRKWEELSELLQDRSKMFDANGVRRKLVIFTENRDTLNYLQQRIETLLGNPQAVVIIHGGLGREERRKAQELFTQEIDVQILVATDAAGEGINLQRAHLMVNYDLPWNPNRIEQRFGRIHRIGQTEVCHLWNLVAHETREGEVYERLLEKIGEQREALGGKVFDVLGKLFQDRSLRELLIEAIRYGERPEVRDRLFKVVDEATDHDHLLQLIEEHGLAREALDPHTVRNIKEQLERAEARRLQPHFIASFFMEAFQHLGGTIREREPRRYEITHVPAAIRNRDRQIGTGAPVLQRYERITFHKDLLAVQGKPLAAFVSPGHPLLDALIDIILERHRELLKRGAVLIDDSEDAPPHCRVLFCLEHSIQDGRYDRQGNRRIVSRRMQFVELSADGIIQAAGDAPYLDYRPATAEEQALVDSNQESLGTRAEWERKAVTYAIENLVTQHFDEVRKYREAMIEKTRAAVHNRLTVEINYWDHRAGELKQHELAGRPNARINSEKARARADELEARLQARIEELKQEKQLSALPPIAIGGALVVPISWIRAQTASTPGAYSSITEERERIERLAMDAVMAWEFSRGRHPMDVSGMKIGYDIESKQLEGGDIAFIEVKGRIAGAMTVTLTKNEILTALNKPDQFILAIVEVEGDVAKSPLYLRKPFLTEPEFAVTTVTYNLGELIEQSETIV